MLLSVTVMMSSDDEAHTQSIFCLGPTHIDAQAVVKAMMEAGLKEIERQRSNEKISIGPLTWGKKD